MNKLLETQSFRYLRFGVRFRKMMVPIPLIYVLPSVGNSHNEKRLKFSGEISANSFSLCSWGECSCCCENFRLWFPSNLDIRDKLWMSLHNRRIYFFFAIFSDCHLQSRSVIISQTIGLNVPFHGSSYINFRIDHITLWNSTAKLTV